MIWPDSVTILIFYYNQSVFRICFKRDIACSCIFFSGNSHLICICDTFFIYNSNGNSIFTNTQRYFILICVSIIKNLIGLICNIRMLCRSENSCIRFCGSGHVLPCLNIRGIRIPLKPIINFYRFTGFIGNGKCLQTRFSQNMDGYRL